MGVWVYTSLGKGGSYFDKRKFAEQDLKLFGFRKCGDAWKRLTVHDGRQVIEKAVIVDA